MIISMKDTSLNRCSYNFKLINIAKKNHTTVTIEGVQRPECNTTKAKNVTFLDILYIVHHVLGLVDAWSDESERFRKKYVFPPPPISPDSLIRATEERNKSARRERAGTVQCKRQSTKDRTGMQNSAEGTNVIVCSVRDEILFMYLQLSALCYSYLSFALFMHFRTSDLRNS